MSSPVNRSSPSSSKQIHGTTSPQPSNAQLSNQEASLLRRTKSAALSISASSQSPKSKRNKSGSSPEGPPIDNSGQPSDEEASLLMRTQSAVLSISASNQSPQSKRNESDSSPEGPPIDILDKPPLKNRFETYATNYDLPNVDNLQKSYPANRDLAQGPECLLPNQPLAKGIIHNLRGQYDLKRQKEKQIATEYENLKLPKFISPLDPDLIKSLPAFYIDPKHKNLKNIQPLRGTREEVLAMMMKAIEKINDPSELNMPTTKIHEQTYAWMPRYIELSDEDKEFLKKHQGASFALTLVALNDKNVTPTHKSYAFFPSAGILCQVSVLEYKKPNVKKLEKDSSGSVVVHDIVFFPRGNPETDVVEVLLNSFCKPI